MDQQVRSVGKRKLALAGPGIATIGDDASGNFWPDDFLRRDQPAVGQPSGFAAHQPGALGSVGNAKLLSFRHVESSRAVVFAKPKTPASDDVIERRGADFVMRALMN
ncbi:hypothetical protein D3C83_58550 [compost metagenome]